jgi:hypothetical protein
MYMVGVWECEGERLPQDTADGLSLIQKAAAKNLRPRASGEYSGSIL